MSRTTMTAALAALLALSAPAAFAADTTTTTTTAPAMHTAVNATRIEPGQLRATDMKGADIYDNQDKNIASIKDMILDRTGKVAAVVIDVDGKYVAVPMSDLKVTMDNSNKPHFAVAMTKDQLKSAQAFDLGTKTESSGSSTAPAMTPATTPPAERSK